MVYALTSPAVHENPPEPIAGGLVADLLRELQTLPPQAVAAIQPCDLKPLEKARNVFRTKRQDLEKRAFRETHGRWPDEPADPAEADPIRTLRLGKARYPAYRETLLAVCPWCAYCGRSLTSEAATLDHVLPKSKGGENLPGNLVLACEGCNQSKGSDTPAAWAFRILTATNLPGQVDELLGLLARLDEAEAGPPAEEPHVLAFRLPDARAFATC